jgi:hypothetical protein
MVRLGGSALLEWIEQLGWKKGGSEVLYSLVEGEGGLCILGRMCLSIRISWVNRYSKGAVPEDIKPRILYVFNTL